MDIQKIIEQLDSLPAEIRTAGQAYLEAKDKVESEKLALNVAMSEAMLKSQKTNATMQKAEAVSNTQEYHKRLLSAELAESRAENELKYLENRFTSIRKIANLEEKMMPSNYSGF